MNNETFDPSSPAMGREIPELHWSWVRELVQCYSEDVLLTMFRKIKAERPMSSSTFSSFNSGSRASSMFSSQSQYSRASTSRTSFDSNGSFGPFAQLYNYPGGDDKSAIAQFPNFQGMSEAALSDSASERMALDHQVATSSPMPTIEESGAPTSHKRFFCPLCVDKVATAWMSRPAEWKRHMTNFHDPNKQYPCIEWACDQMFPRPEDYALHHRSTHNCQNCRHPRNMPKAWACGFEGANKPCKQVFTDDKAWEHWLFHVRKHFLEDGMTLRQWSYSTVIRNLLRRPEVRQKWQDFVSDNLGPSKKARPRFQWQQASTAALRRQLEYSPLSTDIVCAILIQQAYNAGLPSNYHVPLPNHVRSIVSIPAQPQQQQLQQLQQGQIAGPSPISRITSQHAPTPEQSFSPDDNLSVSIPNPPPVPTAQMLRSSQMGLPPPSDPPPQVPLPPPPPQQQVPSTPQSQSSQHGLQVGQDQSQQSSQQQQQQRILASQAQQTPQQQRLPPQQPPPQQPLPPPPQQMGHEGSDPTQLGYSMAMDETMDELNMFSHLRTQYTHTPHDNLVHTPHEYTYADQHASQHAPGDDIDTDMNYQQEMLEQAQAANPFPYFDHYPQHPADQSRASPVDVTQRRESRFKKAIKKARSATSMTGRKSVVVPTQDMSPVPDMQTGFHFQPPVGPMHYINNGQRYPEYDMQQHYTGGAQ